MNRYLLLLSCLPSAALLMQCATASRSPSVAPTASALDAGSSHDEDATGTQDAASPDVSATAEGGVASPAPSLPSACQDAGVQSWYLVARGCQSPHVATLTWVESDGLHQADRDGANARLVVEPVDDMGGGDENHLYARMQWFSELPDECLGPNAHVDEFKTVRRSSSEVVYKVRISNFGYGGHLCHCSYDTTLDGDAVADVSGYLLTARFRGTETTHCDDTPECRPVWRRKPLSFDISRSCSAK